MNIIDSPYIDFLRDEWAECDVCLSVGLSEEDLISLRGFNEVVSLKEVSSMYWPLAQLLHLYIKSSAALHREASDLLGAPIAKVPYVIGVAGSVAVGKSTTSRLLQALLKNWDEHPRVAVIQTDSFLYPNAVLEDKGLMSRKGFPESYDLLHLLRVLQQLKSGVTKVETPVYSHHHYDIIPDVRHCVESPDVVIVEGLNILQTGAPRQREQPAVFVSDYLDFGVFVDAPMALLKQWYLERVWGFCEGPFQEPDAYFHHLTKQSREDVTAFASDIWHTINEVNLQRNILPYKNRADLILEKGAGHAIKKIWLRKV